MDNNLAQEIKDSFNVIGKQLDDIESDVEFVKSKLGGEGDILVTGQDAADIRERLSMLKIKAENINALVQRPDEQPAEPTGEDGEQTTV